MRSSIHTLYLTYLKYKVNFFPENQKDKRYLSISISTSADAVAYNKNINFRNINDIVVATKFFIEKWKNKMYNV